MWLPSRESFTGCLLLNALTINVLCYIKYIHGVLPHYLTQILNLHQRRRSLRSISNFFMLEIPGTKLKSFGECLLQLWSWDLEFTSTKKIRDVDKIESFKNQLKHNLFPQRIMWGITMIKFIWVWYHLCLILINVCNLYIHFIFVQSIIFGPKSFKVLCIFLIFYAEFCEQNLYFLHYPLLTFTCVS